jgi:hypothetical protein
MKSREIIADYRESLKTVKSNKAFTPWTSHNEKIELIRGLAARKNNQINAFKKHPQAKGYEVYSSAAADMMKMLNGFI